MKITDNSVVGDSDNKSNSISKISRIFSKIFVFLKSIIEVSYTKKSKIVGACVSSALIGLIVIFNRSFVDTPSDAKWLLFAAAYFLAIIAGFLCVFKIKIINPAFKKICFVLSFVIFPIITITMTECLNNIWIYDMTFLGFIGNFAVVLLFYFFVYSVSGSIRVCIISISSVLYGFALANAYIMSFRSTPFIPMDFLGITTAINVGNTYDYTPSDIIILGTLLFTVLIIIGIRISTPKYHIITKIISRSFTGIFFLTVFIVFYFTDIFANAGIKPDFWNQARGYRNYGFAYNFLCNTKYIYYPKPKDYDATRTHDYISNQSSEYSPENSYKKFPNIICIMNESLSDLRVLGDFTTNEEYMPFMKSLKENTVKGNLYVPVIGAGTSNTEFEFLTGHSTAFLPSGSNAYMLYIKNPIASIASTLMAQGYSSAAFHPYFANGWNRINVYNYMGFNKFTSIENLFDESLLAKYTKNSSNPNFLQDLLETNYPDRSNMLIRQYVSDSYNYKVLIDDFNNRDKNKPYFIFNVTMQNHGGYLTNARNFIADVNVTSTQSNYTKTVNYLSLIKRSDIAFKELIDYFKKVKEPTLICMFGDHQPSIETDFVAEALGVDDITKLTIEQDQARHITPFYIWANYDIEERYIDKLSSNYLSSYVLKTAKVKLTDFNKYLLALSEKLPVIDTVGYIDNENNYFKWSSDSPYLKDLKEYELIQYNNIFDYENNDNGTFFINGYSVKNIEDSIKAKESATVTQ